VLGSSEFTRFSSSRTQVQTQVIRRDLPTRRLNRGLLFRRCSIREPAHFRIVSASVASLSMRNNQPAPVWIRTKKGLTNPPASMAFSMCLVGNLKVLRLHGSRCGCRIARWDGWPSSFGVPRARGCMGGHRTPGSHGGIDLVTVRPTGARCRSHHANQPAPGRIGGSEDCGARARVFEESRTRRGRNHRGARRKCASDPPFRSSIGSVCAGTGRPGGRTQNHRQGD